MKCQTATNSALTAYSRVLRLAGPLKVPTRLDLPDGATAIVVSNRMEHYVVMTPKSWDDMPIEVEEVICLGDSDADQSPVRRSGVKVEASVVTPALKKPIKCEGGAGTTPASADKAQKARTPDAAPLPSPSATPQGTAPMNTAAAADEADEAPDFSHLSPEEFATLKRIAEDAAKPTEKQRKLMKKLKMVVKPGEIRTVASAIDAIAMTQALRKGNGPDKWIVRRPSQSDEDEQ